MMSTRPSWPIIVLVILSLEKFIQHVFVSYAFYIDLDGIRETVVVDYRWLMVSGLIVGILFLVNIPFLYQRKRFSYYLLLFLALFDIIGEFIAQGTFAIDIVLSFLVALLMLFILILFRQKFFDETGSSASG